VHILDGAPRPGAKILVSGGSRCNVTNAVVTERDYWGGRRTIVRRVLSRLTVAQTIEFFEELGVPLKEEPTAKLFPRSNRSRDVLDGLLRATAAADVTLTAGTRVRRIAAGDTGFRLETSAGTLTAGAVVMATGGLSLPKTGSDGAGLEMARALGHSVVPTTPALAPLVVRQGFHAAVSGVSHDAALSLRVRGRVTERIEGAMLWTHFGVSGPAALDFSRHLLRAKLGEEDVRVSVSLAPGDTFESMDARLTALALRRPKMSLDSALAESLPASLAAVLLSHVELEAGTRLSSLSREARRTLSHALTDLPLDVVDSRGYNYAEATAGGIALDEIDPSTMESRKCPGLFLVGEMLDVDGRLGGFNFQWAWSSGRTAAEGLAAKFGR
jgi:predicted Rossmann fold flavoprotein